jgi:hypothetical protein
VSLSIHNGRGRYTLSIQLASNAARGSKAKACAREQWKAERPHGGAHETRSRRLCLPALAVGALAIDNERGKSMRLSIEVTWSHKIGTREALAAAVNARFSYALMTP